MITENFAIIPNSLIESRAAFYLQQSRAVVSGQRQTRYVTLSIPVICRTYASMKEVPRVIWRGEVEGRKLEVIC